MEKVILNRKRIYERLSFIKRQGSGKNGKYILTDLADEMGYSDYIPLSKYVNGKPIDIKKAKKMAKLLGVHLYYLTGRMSFPTMEEFYENEANKGIKAFKDYIQYIENCCNISILPCVRIHTSTKYIVEHLSDIYDKLTDESKKECDEIIKQREAMSCTDNEPVFLDGDPALFPFDFIDAEDNSMPAGFKNDGVLFLIGFNLVRDGITLRSINVPELLNFIDSVNALTRCVFDTSLLKPRRREDEIVKLEK